MMGAKALQAVTVAEGLPAFVAGAAGAPGLLVIQEWCELPHPTPRATPASVAGGYREGRGS